MPPIIPQGDAQAVEPLDFQCALGSCCRAYATCRDAIVVSTIKLDTNIFMQASDG